MATNRKPPKDPQVTQAPTKAPVDETQKQDAAAESTSAPEPTQAPAATDVPAATQAPAPSPAPAPAPTKAPAPAPTAAPAVATIDDAIEFALNSEDNAQRTLGLVFKNYREMMGRTKATDMADIIEQQAQLWSGLRAGISSKSSFRDCVQFILSVFRENQDGAFTLPMLLRGVDVVGENGPRFNATHREAYVGLVSLLEAAAGMNNPQQVAKTINVAQALKSEAFSAETRQRLIGFFTA